MSRYLSEEALTALEESYEHDLGLAADAVAEIREWRAGGPRITLRWKRIGDHALPMPRRVRPEEAGHDLAVIVGRDMRGPGFAVPIDLQPHEVPRLTVYPGALVNFCLGWAVEIPPSHFGLVHVRSSIGKARWALASSGVVDPSYRGEIKAPLLYLGTEPYTVTHGDRMVQMMIVARPNVEDVAAETLSDTERGTGGFGSTGK